jgi:hypothetical protein
VSGADWQLLSTVEGMRFLRQSIMALMPKRMPIDSASASARGESLVFELGEGLLRLLQFGL